MNTSFSPFQDESFDRPDLPPPSPDAPQEDLVLPPPTSTSCQDLSLVIPALTNRHLRQYQRDGVRFMWGRFCAGGGGLLCDDMGLGKTVQVIALLSGLLLKSGTREDLAVNRRVAIGEVKKRIFLIVCPTSVLYNWKAGLAFRQHFLTDKLRSNKVFTL